MTFTDFNRSGPPVGPSEHNRLRGLDVGDPHPQYADADHTHDTETAVAVPTLAQNGSIALDATSFIRYVRQGAWVVGQATLDIAAAGTAGNAINAYGFPVALSGSAAGSFGYFDSGAVWRQGVVITSAGASYLSFYINGENDQMGISPSFAVASNDALYIQFAYETAT